MARSDLPPPVGVPHVPLVGRERELAQLAAAFSRARSFGAPHCVAITGAEGVGKTRLMQDFLSQRGAGVSAICGRASADKPLSIVGSLLRDRFGIREQATLSESARKDAFRAQVGAVMAPGEVDDALHFLGSFVGLQFPASSFAQLLGENPRQGQLIARTVLRRFLERDAARAPLLVALDDVQHCDSESVDFLRELMANVGGCPVLFLLVGRHCPVIATSIQGVEFSEITLTSLGEEDAHRLFAGLMQRCGDVPRELADAAIDATGGNPRFMEQLVRLFVVNGAVAASEAGWQLNLDKALAIDLPVTVGQAIAARVAALTPAERTVLERAAVFGNVFWRSALVALQRMELGPIEAGWDSNDAAAITLLTVLPGLAERDYILALAPEDSSLPSDEEYIFKHNLEREQILENTPPARLQAYCARAAVWLESRLHRSDEHWEFLGGLYERGGMVADAARCFAEGGRRARARYDVESARAMYERALSLQRGDDAARLEALHNLGDVHEHVGRPDLAAARFREMLALAWRLDAANKGGAATMRLARIARRTGALDEAERRVASAAQLFAQVHDQRGTAAALDEAGRIYAARGDFSAAIGEHRSALAMRMTLGDERSIAVSLANWGRAALALGRWAEAREHLATALAKRRAIGDSLGVAQSLCDLGSLAEARGDAMNAVAHYDEAWTIATDIAAATVRADAISRRAEVELRRGELDGALRDVTLALVIAEASPYPRVAAHSFRRLAEIQMLRGERQIATVSAERALALAMQLGRTHEIGAAQRVQGECCLRHGDVPGGLVVLVAAAARLANRPSSEAEYERVARSLAAAYASQRQQQEARQWGELAEASAKRLRARMTII